MKKLIILFCLIASTAFSQTLTKIVPNWLGTDGHLLITTNGQTGAGYVGAPNFILYNSPSPYCSVGISNTYISIIPNHIYLIVNGDTIKAESALSGLGTANNIAMFTPNGHTLGNSYLYQNGLAVSIANSNNYLSGVDTNFRVKYFGGAIPHLEMYYNGIGSTFNFINIFKNKVSINGAGILSNHSSSLILDSNFATIGDFKSKLILTVTGVANHDTIDYSGITTNRNHRLPDSSGTIALTSNLSSYLPLIGGTLTGPLVMGGTSGQGYIQYNDQGSNAPLGTIPHNAVDIESYNGLMTIFLGTGTSINGLSITGGGNTMNIDATSITGTKTFTFPNTTGTVALTSTPLNLNSSKSIFAPANAGTVNTVIKQINIINPSGTLATLTIDFPSSPSDGDIIILKFTQTITTITWGNGTLVGGATTYSAGTSVIFTYDNGTTSWY